MGFGNVGRAFVALLLRKQQELLKRHNLAWRITGIASRRLGWLFAPEGFLPQALLGGQYAGAQTAKDIKTWLDSARADVLFETTSLNQQTGQPAIDYLRAALAYGAHAISANKGPVVYGYRDLTELAARQSRRYLFESAVMDGVPIFSLFRETMPAVEVQGFRGVLNSTTNVILDGLEVGLEFEQAVRKAQDLGVAETDPANDVDGVDAAVKVVALANVLMNAELTLDDVSRVGIREVRARDIQEARRSGRVLRLVGSAKRVASRVAASVEPQWLEPGDPLALVRGTSSAVSFETDVFPELVITEQNPGLEATAYGLLADLLTAVRSTAK